VAEEFVEMVTTMNPDLEDDQLVEEIRDRTERVKIRADEHLDDH
jgi:Mg-chelatase subunit ChlI